MSDSEDRQAMYAREDAARMLDAQRRMQDGVATYAQLTKGGLSRIDIERAVRRNELRRVHPRVYIDHTGPLTWEQRAWAAVLYANPAVLCRVSLEAPRSRDDGMPIHVAIDHSRKVMPQPGIVIHRMRGLELKAYGGTPPRLKVEDNALAMANEARSEIDAIARVAEVASRSYVTAAGLQAALDRAHSLSRRKLIQGLVDDLASGTHAPCSSTATSPRSNVPTVYQEDGASRHGPVPEETSSATSSTRGTHWWSSSTVPSAMTPGATRPATRTACWTIWRAWGR